MSAITQFVTPQMIRGYLPSLISWGAAGGIAALFLLEPTPIARQDIFQNLPVVGGFWKQKLIAREQKD
ncbi:hypothetical protein BC832DRAFT_389721 [Gaertneriomyces semiglobifer]|nr:hypothetical protein BC832DRAFT_389721 [Gaertneriomyces semiglobifer]